MRRKQLSALFLCSLASATVGGGVAPLLPVYADRLGATADVTGYFMSFSFFAVAAGTVLGGWLSDTLQRRKLTLIVAGVLGIPAMGLMGKATNISQLGALTATGWFLGGAAVVLVRILAGLFAEKTERGKVFGVLAMTNGLGSLIGGLTSGPIADRWGYATLFAFLALCFGLLPLAALFLEDIKVPKAPGKAGESAGGATGLGRSFFLLLLTSLAATISTNVRSLGTSLAMNEMGFAAAAISSTSAVGGAAILPLVPAAGWLSDRVGRKRFLTVCYLTGSVGLVGLAASVSLWHFWVAGSLVFVMASVHNTIGSALVTDLVPPASLGRGLSLFSTTTWVGGIVGYSSAGQSIQRFGTTATFVLGAFLPVLALLLLIPVREVEPDQTKGELVPVGPS
jgi:MFS family permease